jgi:hypothetical protein
LEGVGSVDVSRDGRSVYLTTYLGVLSSWDRAADGALSWGECFTFGHPPGCVPPPYNSLQALGDAALSPDDRWI